MIFLTSLILASAVQSFSFSDSLWELSRPLHQSTFTFKPDRTRHSEKETIADRIRDDEKFSKLRSFLDKDDSLYDELADKNAELTFFAPTDDAFEAFEHEKDRDYDMGEILRYHMTREKLSTKDWYPGYLIKTVLQLSSLKDDHQRLRVERIRGDWFISYSRLIEPDVKLANGMIHAVDRLVMPPKNLWKRLHEFPTLFSTLTTALHVTGLKGLDDHPALTLFAPTNDAWKTLGYRNLAYLFSTEEGIKDLRKILLHHVGKEVVYSYEVYESKESIKIDTMEGSVMLKAVCPHEGKCHDRKERIMVLNQGEARVVFHDGLAGKFKIISCL